MYQAKVHRVPDASTLARLRRGVMVEGERLAVDRVRVLEAEKNAWIEVTLHEGKHHEVKLDPENLLRLILWVDTLCPYRGEEEIREIPDPEFQGVEWLAVRPRIKTAPQLTRPGPL